MTYCRGDHSFRTMARSITLILGGGVSLSVDGDDAVAAKRFQEVVEKPLDTVTVVASTQSFEGFLLFLIFGSCTKSHALVTPLSSPVDLP